MGEQLLEFAAIENELQICGVDKTYWWIEVLSKKPECNFPSHGRGPICKACGNTGYSSGKRNFGLLSFVFRGKRFKMRMQKELNLLTNKETFFTQ